MSRYDTPAGGRDNIAQARYQQERRHAGPENASDVVTGQPGPEKTRAASLASDAAAGKAVEAAGAVRRRATPAAAAVLLLAGVGGALAAIIVRARRRGGRARRVRRWPSIRR